MLGPTLPDLMPSPPPSNAPEQVKLDDEWAYVNVDERFICKGAAMDAAEKGDAVAAAAAVDRLADRYAELMEKQREMAEIRRTQVRESC